MRFPITANHVAEAYRFTGLKPDRHIWFRGEAACGLAVLAMHKTGTCQPESIPIICRLLGIEEGQALGFVEGFDDDIPPHGRPWISKQAYKIGRQAAELVGLPVSPEN